MGSRTSGRLRSSRHRPVLIRRRSSGQALAEFALVLPIALALCGATIDLARAYGVWVTLEGATRNGAEAAARATSATAAAAAARSAVCAETAHLPGYVKQGLSCSSPSVSATWSSQPAPDGSRGLLISTTVRTHLTFTTVVPWPLLTANGASTITAQIEYERLGR